MRNPMFAIRRLTVTCILPATLFGGLVPSESSAQQVPTAATKANAGLPVRGIVRPKAAPTSVPLEKSRSVPTVLVRQNTNSQSPMRPGNPVSSGESDVQRQLRMLYEKNGQEMPAMNFDELEVPEPQAGVSPGQPQGAAQPGQSYAPPAPPPKAPNFFERVFLGKKAPQQAPPRPSLQRPQAMPAAQPRSAQTNTQTQPENPQARQNYRPYQGGQQAPQPGMYGQRPAQLNQPVQTPQQTVTLPQQFNAQTAQPQPQLQTQQQFPSQPNVQVPQTPQRPNASVAGTPATGAPVPQQPKPVSRPAVDDVPLLAEEPEESLELDVAPSAPATANSGAAPAAPLANDSVAAPADAPAADSADSNKPAENPFSGLKLNVPEAPEAKPARPSGGTLSSPASNAIRSVLPSPQPALKVEQPAAGQPATMTPRSSKGPALEQSATPSTRTRLTAKPANPVDKPSLKPLHIPAQAPNAPTSENQRKLAEARETAGLRGFCCVALRQQRALIETRPQFHATHQGQKYYFSSLAAKTAFEKAPDLFVPVYQGKDAVALIDEEETLPGTLDFAAWYQGRLYLFSTRENLDQFKESPEDYVEDRDNEDLTKLTGGRASAVQSTAPVANVAGEAVGNKAKARTSTARPSAVFEDLPVLSDDLDNLEPIAPPTNVTAKPVIESPKPIAIEAIPSLNPPQSQSNTTTTPRTAPRTAPAQPAAAQPAPKRTPPKLISPDLRLIPATKDAPQ